MRSVRLLTFFMAFVFLGTIGKAGNASLTSRTFTLKNDLIQLRLTLSQGRLIRETLQANPEARATFNGQQPVFDCDGNVAFDINWTDWRAPHKINNGENPVMLTATDFRFVRSARQNTQESKRLDLFFKGREQPLILRISYRLKDGQFWVNKQVALRDTSAGVHFLRFIYPMFARITPKFTVIKRGGFGQPVALRSGSGSFFCGLEYPAGTNSIRVEMPTGHLFLQSGVEAGKKIGASWIESPWLVMALTPSAHERLWFDRYLASQRVQPLRPYVLYNSWYDLRSPAFKNIPAKNIMNEQNILRIIDLIQKNFVEKNGIHLDAFVLDDGWDVYASDWVLRSEQFPHGLRPIVERLKDMSTALGMWFGPTGGYSFRMRRINWMGEHGYEVIGAHARHYTPMLCVAGKHYSQLLKKRTTDFVKEGVAFFKWDGIQFSCSEPDHGHPIGLYSQRAVMDTVIELCNAVREINPQTFLNITSGTWLSPWWVKYANQIWMQGGDYGYSDIPSISRRDAAMTYRDINLYQDFNVHNFWFPIANLMTHGIIKGQLQKLGGEQEPLDKFTNNALLYFARGVSMWELYISPDILSDAEWNAIARSLKWAKQNFDILKHTSLLGGNPAKGEAYAYVHFNANQGIVAARNPFVLPQSVSIPLSDTLGLDKKARNLVLEQIYPVRWISPRLYKQGEEISLKLQGYETVVYRIFPIEQARRPLPANVIFSGEKAGDKRYRVVALAQTGMLKMLNPSFSKRLFVNNKKAIRLTFNIPPADSISGLHSAQWSKKGNEFDWKIELKPHSSAQFALLLREFPGGKAERLPVAEITLNKRKVQAHTEEAGPQWRWITVPLQAGSNTVHITLRNSAKSARWQGQIESWLFTDRAMPETVLLFETAKSVETDILPPRPRAQNVLHHVQRLALFHWINGKLVIHKK